MVIDYINGTNILFLNRNFNHDEICSIAKQMAKINKIDFSVLNYLPKVIELAVAMFGVCLTNDREILIDNMNILVNEYNKYNKLDSYEINILPIIFNCISSMNILQTSFIKVTDETFDENEHQLSKG